MHLSRVYDWYVIKKLYTEVVSQIEQGLIIWGSRFETIIQWALAQNNSNATGSNNKQNAKTPVGKQQYAKKAPYKARPTYCKDYQQNACSFSDDKHWGTVNGERMMVEHVCAACLMRRKETARHSEASSECPCKGSSSRNSQQ